MSVPNFANGRASKHVAWLGPAVGVLVVSFHIQATPEIAGNPIRISAAELVAPFIGIGLLITSPRVWPIFSAWRVRGVYLWLIALTAVMTAALVMGRIYTGTWMPWALYNKYAGWFVLVGYFLLGGWIVARFGTPAYRAVLRPFLIACWLIAGYSLLDYMIGLFFETDLPGGSDTYRLTGFLENPNAFGLMAAIALAIQLPFMSARRMFGSTVSHLGASVLFAALILSISRSAWAGMLLALVTLVLLRSAEPRTVLRTIVIGGALASLIAVALPLVRGATAPHLDPQSFQALPGGRLVDPEFLASADDGLLARLQSSRLAVQMWREQPVLGIGIGGFLAPQLAEQAPNPVAIHSTYLWLLVETGIVGFAMFAGFAVFSAWHLVGSLERAPPEARIFLVAVLAVVAAFAGASVGMEAMYQRHIWFLAGCALALPGATGKLKPDKAESNGFRRQ